MGKRTFLAGVLLAAAAWSGVRAQTAPSTAQNAPTQDVEKLIAQLPKPTGYVSDIAGVIDPESKQQMEALCRQLDTQAHAQVAVVTIHSLGGNTAAEFANKLEEKWKVGPKSTDRGLIMLFSIDDHKRWIEVGYGLEGILNDAKVGDIGRSMVPQLRAAQYGPAIYGGLQQIAQDIATDAGVTLAVPQPQQPMVYHREPVQRGIGVFSIIKIVVFLIILIVVISGRGGGGSGWLWFLLGNMMGGGGGRGRDDGFGGGGGDSGGGFGGFGGGSSGGGGAGGDW
jgi:uncharacterized protein